MKGRCPTPTKVRFLCRLEANTALLSIWSTQCRLGEATEKQPISSHPCVCGGWHLTSLTFDRLAELEARHAHLKDRHSAVLKDCEALVEHYAELKQKRADARAARALSRRSRAS